MLASLRREYGHFVVSGTQLVLLFVGFKLQSRIGWLICLSPMALISIFAWFSALRRLRQIHDTPTSRISAAAQGYAELIGKGKPFPGVELISRQYGLPCLWYRYKVQHKNSEGKLETVNEGESTASFIIDDGSDQCVVDPSGAEILTIHKETWWRDNFFFTEWKLLDIDTIYAIGQFRTYGGSSMQTNLNEEVKEVLAEWKRDMPDLHRRFDLNEDGQLDMQEWMLARQAAKREAAKRMDALRAQPDVNYLVQPQDGRLFLISNLPQSKLERRYWFWTWAHLAIFLGALGGLSWVLSLYGSE